MLKKTVVLLATFLAYVISAQTANAGTVYDEAVSGDLVGNGNGNLIELFLGSNDIFGTSSAGASDESDEFVVFFSPGLQISGGVFTAQGGGGGVFFNSSGVAADCCKPNGPGLFTFQGFVEDSGTTVNILQWTTPALFSINSNATLTDAPWSFNFTVEDPSVVPIPAALPLFLSAFAGLGFIARRKKKMAV